MIENIIDKEDDIDQNNIEEREHLKFSKSPNNTDETMSSLGFIFSTPMEKGKNLIDKPKKKRSSVKRKAAVELGV